MKKVFKLFFDIRKEQDWLAAQEGWKLVKTNGFRYVFEESENRYCYEYIYFEKSKKELGGIISQIADKSIELVCSTLEWALFRKDTQKGDIHVFAHPFEKYSMLMKKYDSYIALGVCYLCLVSSQIALSTTLNSLFYASGGLFFACSAMFFVVAGMIKKYAAEYDDGTYAARMKLEGKKKRC